MNDNRHDSTQRISMIQRIDQICLEFEKEWKAGRHPRIESFLADCPPQEHSILLSELLGVELEYRNQRGDSIAVADYVDLFPDHRDTIAQHISDAATDTVMRICSEFHSAWQAGGSSRPGG